MVRMRGLVLLASMAGLLARSDAELCGVAMTPCECAQLETDGCGWSGTKQACEYGRITNCLECPAKEGCLVEDIENDVGSGASAMETPDMQGGGVRLTLAALDVLPDYSGGLKVSGRIHLTFSGTKVVVDYALEGADPACASPSASPSSCGMYIHAGKSCDQPQDHFYPRDFFLLDPWRRVHYLSDSVSANGSVEVEFGESWETTQGRVFILYDHSGNPVTCTKLVPALVDTTGTSRISDGADDSYDMDSADWYNWSEFADLDSVIHFDDYGCNRAVEKFCRQINNCVPLAEECPEPPVPSVPTSASYETLNNNKHEQRFYTDPFDVAPTSVLEAPVIDTSVYALSATYSVSGPSSSRSVVSIVQSPLSALSTTISSVPSVAPQSQNPDPDSTVSVPDTEVVVLTPSEKPFYPLPGKPVVPAFPVDPNIPGGRSRKMYPFPVLVGSSEISTSSFTEKTTKQLLTPELPRWPPTVLGSGVVAAEELANPTDSKTSAFIGALNLPTKTSSAVLPTMDERTYPAGMRFPDLDKAATPTVNFGSQSKGRTIVVSKGGASGKASVAGVSAVWNGNEVQGWPNASPSPHMKAAAGPLSHSVRVQHNLKNSENFLLNSGRYHQIRNSRGYGSSLITSHPYALPQFNPIAVNMGVGAGTTAPVTNVLNHALHDSKALLSNHNIIKTSLASNAVSGHSISISDLSPWSKNISLVGERRIAGPYPSSVPRASSYPLLQQRAAYPGQISAHSSSSSLRRPSYFYDDYYYDYGDYYYGDDYYYDYEGHRHSHDHVLPHEHFAHTHHHQHIPGGRGAHDGLQHDYHHVPSYIQSRFGASFEHTGRTPAPRTVGAFREQTEDGEMVVKWFGAEEEIASEDKEVPAYLQSPESNVRNVFVRATRAREDADM